MAKVTRTSGRNRFGAAVEGALKGAAQGIELGVKLQNAKTQQGFLQAQMEQVKLKQEESAERRRLLGQNALNTLMGEAILTDDPKTFFQNRSTDFQKAIDASQSQMSLDTLQQMAQVKNQDTKLATQEMLQNKSKLFTMTPFNTNEEQLQSVIEKGQSAFNKVINTPELSNDARQEFARQRQVFEQQAQRLQAQIVQSKEAALTRQSQEARAAQRGAKKDSGKLAAAGESLQKFKETHNRAFDAIDKKIDRLPKSLANAVRQARDTGVLPSALINNKVARSNIPELQEIESQKNIIGPQFARLFDSGNLPDAMIERFQEQVLPGLLLSKEAANASFEALERMTQAEQAGNTAEINRIATEFLASQGIQNTQAVPGSEIFEQNTRQATQGGSAASNLLNRVRNRGK